MTERPFTKVDAAFVSQIAEAIRDEESSVINNNQDIADGLRDIAIRIRAAIPIESAPIVKRSISA